MLILGGMFFFVAGTVGLFRYPDFFTRLHALTKADNLGLGLVIAGLAVQASSWAVSYTHLDVYKRQRVYSAKRSRISRDVALP